MFFLFIKGIIFYLKNIGYVYFKKFECEIVNICYIMMDDDIWKLIVIGYISYLGYLKYGSIIYFLKVYFLFF